MTEAASDTPGVPPAPVPPAPRRRRGRFGLTLLLSLVLLGALAAFAALGLTGKPLRLPVWAVAEAEHRINRAIAATEGALSIGAIVLRVDRDWVPRLRLEDVRLLQPGGAALAQVSEMRVAFDPDALLQGQIRPRSLRVIGANLNLVRLPDGRFDVRLAGAAGPVPGGFAGLLGVVDGVFAQPALASLRRIEAEALTVTLNDRQAGRVWQVGDGRLTLENRTDEIAVEVGLGLVAGGQTPARAVLTFVSAKGTPAARIGATVDRVAAADIAAQAPLLAWLGVLDAPISGNLHASVDAGGAVSGLDGTLEIAAGALRPTEASRPIAFDRAGLYFSYDPQMQKLTFSDLRVESPSLRLSAAGQTYLIGMDAGRPESLVSQVQFSEVTVDPEGLFEEPARFSSGALDLRLRLDPFSVEIGQLSLVDEATRLTAKGQVTADAAGWAAAVDLRLNEIAHDRLLALWPVDLKPRTRDWLVQNVQEGRLFNVAGALRVAPGQDPRVSLGWEFAAADVRFLKTLPPIRQGYGYSTIDGTVYTLVLDRGHVVPPEGGQIAVARSVFQVPDVTVKPAMAEIALRTDSSVTAALSLLDEPPFEFLKKSGRPVALGTGRAVVETRLRLPLKPKVTLPEVDYSVSATLRDIRSEVLVPGRVLTAPALALRADRTALTVGGAGRLGAVPFDATWTQKFGPEFRGKSRVEGHVTLGPDTLADLGVGLPQGMVSGAGPCRIEIDLTRDAPARFVLSSDLTGIGLSIPAVGWSLTKGTAGRLAVAGRLGQPPVIDRLTLDAPGLSAAGTVSVSAQGGLDRARFSQVRLGDWLDGPVDLVGRGKGQPPAVAVLGGTADLRRVALGSRGGARQGGPPLTVALDRLTVTEGIALTGFRGEFSAAGGFNGTFSGRVNGRAPVMGTVAPSRNGTAVRIRSDDAGAVFAAAGVFDKMRGGSLDLTLLPRGPTGDYDGRALMRNFSVKNVPVLAELLSSLSIIGMVEQLQNAGLVFGEADAEFRLTPQAIGITRGAAVGASLGVSMEGVYDVRSKRIDMQGVISPVYLVNGIGSVLTRRGEGLFGFNYRVTGSAADPQVSVNPLSILTPGMFREIFRRAPPRVGEATQ